MDGILGISNCTVRMLTLLNKWDIVVEVFALRYRIFTFTFTIVWFIESKRSYVHKLWFSRVFPTRFEQFV